MTPTCIKKRVYSPQKFPFSLYLLLNSEYNTFLHKCAHLRRVRTTQNCIWQLPNFVSLETKRKYIKFHLITSSRKKTICEFSGLKLGQSWSQKKLLEKFWCCSTELRIIKFAFVPFWKCNRKCRFTYMQIFICRRW